jgi:hypothetical protein
LPSGVELVVEGFEKDGPWRSWVDERDVWKSKRAFRFDGVGCQWFF